MKSLILITAAAVSLSASSSSLVHFGSGSTGIPTLEPVLFEDHGTKPGSTNLSISSPAGMSKMGITRPFSLSFINGWPQGFGSPFSKVKKNNNQIKTHIDGLLDSAASFDWKTSGITNVFDAHAVKTSGTEETGLGFKAAFLKLSYYGSTLDSKVVTGQFANSIGYFADTGLFALSLTHSSQSSKTIEFSFRVFCRAFGSANQDCGSLTPASSKFTFNTSGESYRNFVIGVVPIRFFRAMDLPVGDYSTEIKLTFSVA